MNNTREVVTYAKKYINGDVLDYGAGSAKYRDIIELCSATYIAFDVISGSAIDVVGDVLNPPFADASFDTIISTQVLEHVERPWIMVAQIARILRTDGVCVATAPFMLPYHADPHDFFRYTKEGLQSLFINEGFDILESGSYGKTFGVFSEMLHFVWLNPYENKGERKWSTRIMRRVERLAGFLDGFVKNEIIYPNVYVVAKKKEV